MKTLILYASKSGASKEVAKYVGKKIKGSSVVNFNEKQPNLKKYDLIILGSGIYFNKINRKFKKYINNNIDDLLEKKFAIFFCCAVQKDKDIKKIIDKNFKGQLQDNALAIVCAGGYLQPSMARWPNSTVIWLTQQALKTQKKEQPEINYNELDKFIELIASITIIEKDRQLRNNPIPPIKDIKTRKERVNKTNNSKNQHKQIKDQTQKPKNEKINTKNMQNKPEPTTRKKTSSAKPANIKSTNPPANSKSKNTTKKTNSVQTKAPKKTQQKNSKPAENVRKTANTTANKTKT